MNTIECPHCKGIIDIVTQPVKQKTNGKWFCSECNNPIPEHVKDWSERNLGKSLCYDCQAKTKEK